ncbi:hypothetical protein CHRYSEOSP005_02580 [Chryseobacterium sp. Alg-005]
MKDNSSINNESNEGITREQIEKMESFAQNKFPDSYREFLYLGGESNNVIQFSESSSFSIYENLRSSVERVLSDNQFKMEKDFWVISSLDGGEQFHFFFFDEGDNPPVYYYCSYLDEWENSESKPGYKKINNSFSEYIEKKIKGIKS